MDMLTGEDGMLAVSASEMARASAAEIDACRRAAPLVRSDPQRVVALRAADVLPLSSDPRLPQIPGNRFVAAFGLPPGRVQAFLKNMMLMTNGAEHHRMRGAFAKTFAHPVIRGKRAEIRAVADAIVADLPRGRDFDFLDLCASRLPAEVIATVLGLPVTESRWFAEEVYSLSRCLTIPYAMEDHDAIEASAEALYGFVEAALEERRAMPREDLLSALAADETARALEAEVLTYQVMLLLLAGADTTRSGFTMLVGRLLGDQALWQEVRDNRELIPAAVDEALRLEPPVGSLPRFVAAPIEVGGCPVAAGQIMGLSTLSAMRDEACHADPEYFHLHRGDHVKLHPVFGGGAHRCLGEMLARIELEEGLAALIEAAPEITFVEAPRMLGFSGIRRATPMVLRID